MSLRVRLLLVILGIYGVGGYFITRWMLDQIRPRYLESMEESLVDTSAVLAAMIEADATQNGPDVANIRKAFERAGRQGFDAKIFSLAKTTIDLRVRVVNAQGRVLFDSTGRAEGQDFSRWNDVARTLRGQYGARSTRDIPGDDSTQVLYVAAPIRHDRQIVGAISVGKPTQGINALVEAAKQKILIGAVIGGVTLLLVLLLVAAWIIAPLERLTAYARAVRDGRTAVLPPLPGQTLTELGRTFEEMRDALAGRRHAERYTQALAHEVKAPLTAIRGGAELLEEEMPVEQRQKFIANIRRESARIEKIIERLLELTSVEALKALRQTELIASGELVTEAVEGVRAAFESKGVTLITESGVGWRFEGERFLLRQALINLLQNALDFSSRGKTVRFGVSESAGHVVFTISDDGPGVPEYALARVFDRFYSLARPGTTQKSTGIGLALVREIAYLHGGDAMLSNCASGGAEAIISVPLSKTR
jgi:two-component system, OmpR family, sensor histidine kinase CreC